MSKDIQQFIRQNEVSRLLNTKTVTELVHQLVNEREIHRKKVDQLKRRLRRKKNEKDDGHNWSKNMLHQFQNILNSERKRLVVENQQHQEALKMISRVNSQLETDNIMLVKRIKILEKQVIRLTSERMVESILLQKSRLKDVVKEKSRSKQIQMELQSIAIKNAFDFASKGVKREKKLTKLKLLKKKLRKSSKFG
jgi:hypothetical protein